MSDDISEQVKDISTRELQREIERRKALELRDEYQKQIVISKFVADNHEIFQQLAEHLNKTRLAEFLADPHHFWGQILSVDISIEENEALYEKCFPNGSGKAIWEQHS